MKWNKGKNKIARKSAQRHAAEIHPGSPDAQSLYYCFHPARVLVHGGGAHCGRQSIPSHTSKVSPRQRGPSAGCGTSGGLCHLRRPGSLIFHQSSAPHTRRVSCSRASRRILRAFRASPHPLCASTNPSNQTPPSSPPLPYPSPFPHLLGRSILISPH